MSDAPSISPRAAETRGFANHLFEQGEYYRAIGEYQRYLYLHPNAPDAEIIRLRGAMAYLFGGEHRLANHALARLSLSLENRRYARMAAFGRCQASYLDGAWKPAAMHLTTFLKEYPTPSATDDPEGRQISNHARLMLGWSLVRANRLKQAETTFAKLAENAPEEKGYSKLVDKIHAIRVAPRGKTPWLAGLLSVVPGLGHAYIGRPDIALFSLAWNSLFIYAAADNIAQENYGTGSILSAFALLWYSGTIYGAVNGAHKWNRDMRLNKVDDLEVEFPPDPGLKFLRTRIQNDSKEPEQLKD